MKIQIVGKGSFGTFLNEILGSKSILVNSPTQADCSILAVPASAYKEVADEVLSSNPSILLVNVCSAQYKTTQDLLSFTTNVLSIHPLFGKRTPVDKRNSILTHDCKTKISYNFLQVFSEVSTIHSIDQDGCRFTPLSHDLLMRKTHVNALLAAKQMKIYTDQMEDVPDHLLPNSSRLLKEFVKTLTDMPSGTVESILSNPYF